MTEIFARIVDIGGDVLPCELDGRFTTAFERNVAEFRTGGIVDHGCKNLVNVFGLASTNLHTRIILRLGDKLCGGLEIGFSADPKDELVCGKG